MASKIVLPAVALLVAFAFGSGNALHCYECTSVGAGDDRCMPEKLMKDMGAKTECSYNSMTRWYNDMKGKVTLNRIAGAFELSGPGHNDMMSNVPMSCIKMNLRVDNQPVTLRTCHDSKTSSLDPCQSIQRKIKEVHDSSVVEFCGWCENDMCNSSSALSPMKIVSIVTMLVSILMCLMH